MLTIVRLKQTRQSRFFCWSISRGRRILWSSTWATISQCCCLQITRIQRVVMKTSSSTRKMKLPSTTNLLIAKSPSTTDKALSNIWASSYPLNLNPISKYLRHCGLCRTIKTSHLVIGPSSALLRAWQRLLDPDSNLAPGSDPALAPGAVAASGIARQCWRRTSFLGAWAEVDELMGRRGRVFMKGYRMRNLTSLSRCLERALWVIIITILRIKLKGCIDYRCWDSKIGRITGFTATKTTVLTRHRVTSTHWMTFLFWSRNKTIGLPASSSLRSSCSMDTIKRAGRHRFLRESSTLKVKLKRMLCMFGIKYLMLLGCSQSTTPGTK